MHSRNYPTQTHLAQFWILYYITIAAKLLLQIFQDLFVAVLLLHSLHSRQGFPTIPLLYAHMHILFGACTSVLSICISKWICRTAE